MKSFHSSVLTTSNEEGIERARNGKYAYILPSTIGHYISLQSPCNLVTVDRFLMKEGFGLAVQKGGSLREQLDRALILLEQEGFLAQLYDKYWVRSSQCNGIQSSKMYSLSPAPPIHHSRQHAPLLPALTCLLTLTHALHNAHSL